MSESNSFLEAMEACHTLQRLYADMRSCGDPEAIADLLRRADESAAQLRARLAQIDLKTCKGNDADAVRKALGNLGEHMERLLVQEREFRLTSEFSLEGNAPQKTGEPIDVGDLNEPLLAPAEPQEEEPQEQQHQEQEQEEEDVFPAPEGSLSVQATEREPSIPDHDTLPTAAGSMTDHFGLSENPFGDRIDARYYYRSKGHQQAELRLRAAAEQGMTPVLVTGVSGVGKSLLRHVVAHALDAQSYRVVKVNLPPDSGKTVLLRAVLEAFEVDLSGVSSSVKGLVGKLSTVVREEAQAGHTVVLAIDRGEYLTADGLRAFELVCDIPQETGAALRCWLFAEDRLLSRLKNASFESLRTRFALKVKLEKFNPEDTAAYIRHCERVAGGTRNIFTASAMDAIYQYAQGQCRAINKACAGGMLEAYVEQSTLIEPRHIHVWQDS